jgi:hypothetical protein
MEDESSTDIAILEIGIEAEGGARSRGGRSQEQGGTAKVSTAAAGYSRDNHGTVIHQQFILDRGMRLYIYGQ